MVPTCEEFTLCQEVSCSGPDTAKALSSIISFDPHKLPRNGSCCYFCFTELSNFAKVTELKQISLILKPMLLTTWLHWCPNQLVGPNLL